MSSLAKRPDGRWRARYRDEAGKEHSRHFPRKVDGQNWLNEVTASVVTGQYVDPAAGRITFATYYKAWAARQVWEPGTTRAMDLAAGSVTFSDVPMGKLVSSHVEQWVKSMSARQLAPGTIHTRFNNVRGVLRSAVRDRIIASDPSDNVRLPRRRRLESSMTIPTAGQVASLLKAADPGFQPFIAVCAFAGLRLGEAAALQVGDIDFLGRTLLVARQVQRENAGAVDIKAPKYGSERTLYVPDDLTVILAQFIETNRPGDDPERWLFPGESGNPWHQNTVGYWWRMARDDAGVVNVRLHDLRHWFASGLISHGCDVVTVQRALGHRSATTTLNTYSHIWPTAEDRTRKAAAGMMAAVSGDRADSVRTQQAE